MDWSKAKTILIIAFLITNAILGSILYTQGNKKDLTVTESFVEEVVEILEKKQIYVDAEISKEIPMLNNLEVEYEILDLNYINNIFFGGKGEINLKERDLIKVSKDKEDLTIFNKKILIYENNNYNRKKLYDNLDKEKAENIALEFLKDKKFQTSDMKLSFVKEKNKSYILEFSKIYDERYLEIAYTTIEVDNKGVKRVERLWLNALNEGDIPIYISTAPKAILDLLDKEEFYGKTIIDISLCYYFEPKKDDYMTNPKDAKKGKSIPAWRILFKDGQKEIIDTY